MQKKHEISDHASCLNIALPDEYTFVLLGRDPAAPVAIQAWIDERVRLGKNTPTDKQILDAHDVIVDMNACRDIVRDEVAFLRVKATGG